LQKSILNLVSFADLISITNAICGLLAIFVLFTDFAVSDLRLRVAFSFILLALLADGLDGIVARKTSQSDLGEYFESMADMTSLAIAPAIFIYVIYLEKITVDRYQIYLILVLLYLVTFSIIRLASFHIMKEKKFFVGIPASASTIILITLAYLEIDFFYMLIAIVIITPALIGYIKFPKPGIKVNAVASALIILTLIFDKSYNQITIILLFAAILIYSIAGPIYLLIKK